jgi:hypothetical protein
MSVSADTKRKADSIPICQHPAEPGNNDEPRISASFMDRLDAELTIEPAKGKCEC